MRKADKLRAFALEAAKRGKPVLELSRPQALPRRIDLEQLRALEAGMRIDAAIVASVPLGVDTPEDLETARHILGR